MSADQEDENAAELRIGDEFLKAKCLMNCEVSRILEHRYQQMQQMADHQEPMNGMPQVFEKSLQYAQRFARYKTQDSARQVREILSNHPLAEFELCVLGNLSPDTAQEAFAMVPSIKDGGRTIDEEAMGKILGDLALVRNFE